MSDPTTQLRLIRRRLRHMAQKALWPFCRKCGVFGWHSGRLLCYKHQYENLMRWLDLED